MTAFPTAPGLLDPLETAAALPFPALLEAVHELLLDDTVRVPPRLVQPLPGGGSLFVMPATDARVAITKLITFTPANAGARPPSIQGDVVVFDVATADALLILDGPTVTARRTAAVSLLAAQAWRRVPAGPLLIVGAGVQGRAHLEAFAAGLGVREVWIASRSAGQCRSAGAPRPHAWACAPAASRPRRRAGRLPAGGHLHPGQRRRAARPAPRDAFIAAVGAFTPRWWNGPRPLPPLAVQAASWWTPATPTHEAGDLLQAGLDVAAFATLCERVVRENRPRHASGPVLFKSCGWAGWDLAAARLGRA